MKCIILFLATGVIGCQDASGMHKVQPSGFNVVAESLCARIKACDNAAVPDLTYCSQFYAQKLLARHTILNEEFRESCLAQLGLASCTSLQMERWLPIESCRRALVGPYGLSMPCRSSLDCNQLRCGGLGVCVPLLASGEKCQGTQDCEFGLLCRGGRCENAIGGVGDSCAGDACQDSLLCVDSLDSKCALLPGADDACLQNQCDDTAYCTLTPFETHMCRARLQDGSPCIESEWCQPGSTCKGSDHCGPAGFGSTCVAASDCYPNDSVCLNNICSRYRLENDACGPNVGPCAVFLECKHGLCSPD
jgi:hypothetical protein